ncbi:Holliday junction resolvase RuvX [Carnobacterium pleistocenium]|uniref:Holliday junction resolvase RuvX n=1 Tax=Carnobacterium pleistocenium TaxID=181073 RepID=UPI00054EAC02|nr:Holliday junction resolvase RuvX [Carnobacterium pleistocenium]
MRTMGLDVGSKTVGVAVSDPFGWTAQGIEIVKINEVQEEYGIDRIGELINIHEVTKVVIGLPKNMNNSIGPRAEASLRYAELIKETFNLPVILQDERLTTVQAERMLIEEGNTSRAKRKKVIDKLAAVIILQNYLNQNQN